MTTLLHGSPRSVKLIWLLPRVNVTKGGAGGPENAAFVVLPVKLTIPHIVEKTENWYANPDVTAVEFWNGDD